MLRSKEGARIEIVSFSEWLANTKRTKEDARIEIATFSDIVSRIENAALKERRANRDRELFRMARE